MEFIMKRIISVLVIVCLLSLLPNWNASAASADVKKPYAIATVQANGSKKVTATYATFAAANKNFKRTNNTVLLYKNIIIKMNSGIVVAKAPRVDGITHIYPTAELKANRHTTGVAYGNELEYVSASEKAIKVKYAGQEGYVSHSEAYLLPSAAMGGNSSYYQVNQSRFITHVVYNHAYKRQDAYFYGKAPSTVKPGRYTSWDGINFTAQDGKKAAPFYQYFNLLPFRTMTNYSAAELDALIMKRLRAKEAEAKKKPQYRNATKKSKLIGLGRILKEQERTNRVNALMVLAQAIHESDYGMSPKAQKLNNLFGIEVYDGNPEAGKKYSSPGESVRALVENVLNPTYIPADSGYANGSHFGNKYRGVNVRYAMDQYWGQKIAGHLYLLDKEMGGKDFIRNKNAYKLYENTTGLNVRSTPEVMTIPNNKIYRYNKSGFVVAVLGSEKKTDYTWHTIISDRLDAPYGYVARGEASLIYLRPLTIAK